VFQLIPTKHRLALLFLDWSGARVSAIDRTKVGDYDEARGGSGCTGRRRRRARRSGSSCRRCSPRRSRQASARAKTATPTRAPFASSGRGWYQERYRDELRGKRVLDFGCGFADEGMFFAGLAPM
jgi:hypothetical protein